MNISSVLNDDQASPVGDLYIRSVCFSPDGKYLATGAEDKTIRVSTSTLSGVLSRHSGYLRFSRYLLLTSEPYRFGRSPSAGSGACLKDIPKKYILLTFQRTVD